ncbi:MAG: FtsX-like permease family protein [Siphonobacter sp.]
MDFPNQFIENSPTKNNNPVLIVYLAIKYLLAKKGQSIISALSVTFGTSMFILLINFMNGVNDFLDTAALEGTPDLKISVIDSIPITDSTSNVSLFSLADNLSKNTPKLENYKTIDAFLRNNNNVKGTSSQITTQAIFSRNGAGLPGAIFGVSITDEDKLFDLKSRIIAGDIYALQKNANGVILGQTLASKLNVKVGQQVTITTLNGKLEQLDVVALFSFGVSFLDNGKSYMNIHKVQEILNVPDSTVSDINVKLNDRYLFSDISATLQEKFKVKTENWQEANRIIMTSIEVRNVLTWVVSIALLIVAGFGIYNIMNINVLNKYKDIALLKTLGFSYNDVKYVFFIQSLIIGLVGSFFGMIIGYILCVIMSKIPFDTGEILNVKYYPMNYDFIFYMIGAVLGIITTVLAGFIPAKKASKIDPVVILRGQ